MDKYEFWLDGESSDDVGIRCDSLSLSSPVPNTETLKIPGRNGALHIFDGSFANRKGMLSCYVYRPDFVKDAFGAIQAFLFGKQGYRKIVTDDDREHFLIGRVSGGADMEARIKRLAPFRLQFDCKPQRFLTIGEEVITITEGTAIFNPTAFISMPIYTIYGYGDVSITVGDNTAYFKDVGGSVTYDAETENAYHSTENRNLYATAPNGLPFGAGEQNVTFEGDISKIEIIPRWWEL